MALKKVKGSLERVFEKNLQDLVRGIRSNKENEAKYIASCIEEIKNELKQDNMAVKANAVAKLTYIQMLGYDISWAAFNIIEVMSSSKFTFKRTGYLAASQCFHEGTEVLMLTTNMVRKDVNSANQYEAGISMSGLACFTSPDLARDLANDLMSLMASTKPYVRKKAVLLMYKIFLKFPEALRPAFPRLKAKLEDPDPGVQSAAVNVICELARQNPKNYLSLAPLFFKLMTTSTNNWMLIKIIKLFGALTPLEPRLGKKLLEPLTNLIHSTSAMSLLYECINTVISVLVSLSSGMPDQNASIQLCVQKLRILIEDSDQNLKYLGLLAMSKILKTHPKSVQNHKDLILDCLDDRDESIRLRALDLLYGMVSKKNLMEIVKKLMVHVDKAEGSIYRDELLSKIIQICSQNNYQYIINFEWYISILVELTRIEGTKHGHLIASQMLDVAIRVKAIQPFACKQMAQLLENTHLIVGTAVQANGICEVLYAAAWIVGEFPQHLLNPRHTLDAMFHGRITSLPGHIQSIYVQNIVKLYSAIIHQLEEEEDKEKCQETTLFMLEKLPQFTASAHLEVQERACCIIQLLKYVNKLLDKDVWVAEELTGLFEGELNPVAPKAQKKVPVPEGLDLDKWINSPPSDDSDDEVTIDTMFIHDANRVNHTPVYEELSEEEMEKRRAARRVDQANNPHYLKDDKRLKPKKKKLKDLAAENSTVDSIPVAEIDLNVPLHVPGESDQTYSELSGISVTDEYMKKANLQTKKKHRKKHKRGKRGRRDSNSSDDIPVAHKVDIVEEEMPEGADLSDHDGEDERPADDPHRALDIDLERPLDEGDRLPVREHYEVGTGLKLLDKSEGAPTEKPKRKHRKGKEEKGGKSKKDGGKDKKKKKKKVHKETEGVSKQPPEDGEIQVEEPNLMGGAEEEEEIKVNGVTEKEVPQTQDVEEKKVDETKANSTNEMDDISYWLSKDEEAEKIKPEEIKDAQPKETEVTEGSKKSKKEKKSKKDKKKDKKKNHHVKEEYEQVGNGETSNPTSDAPATEDPQPAPIPPMSSYRLLAENPSIKMTYETRIDPKQTNQVVISVIFSNLTSNHLKSLEFNVLDSLNTKLIREIGASTHDGVKVPFQLPPSATNEGQFAFKINSINMSQKLRGTLTYVVKDDDGSTSEKLDFKVHLPISSYVTATPCNSDQFARLLSGGDLTGKSSVTAQLGNSEFREVLARICFHAHLGVVERVDSTVSLYGRSIQGHDICVLIKAMPNGSLSIDGKSTDASLISNFLDEIRTLGS
ncbi:AP-3 complex subunit delta-1-like isoform X3 [Apostichopus japonicus]|uniref:AP-3 complex subunit delta-1-like isoform X3 n=1 Tax=Stichopus japonicus TaxID=307972 RepID=UPI003AB355D2